MIPVGDHAALAHAIDELAAMSRDLAWAAARMRDYSVESSAQSIVSALQALAAPRKTNA